MPTFDERIVQKARLVTRKRAKTVIDHILQYGFITTEQLKDQYGYNHPPRAIRDVREEGIPLTTYKVKGSDGRSIAAYKFGDSADITYNKLGGRTVFSKAFKNLLIIKYDSRCVITNEVFEDRYLQIDHRIPYEVAGDSGGDERTPEKFMLLSAPAQRQKSWSCEHCKNYKVLRNPSICEKCYWASPEEYEHIAMESIKQIELVWKGEEVVDYETLNVESINSKKPVQHLIKEILHRYLGKKF
jgi:hypothetical protein